MPKILVVDDSESVLAYLEAVLREASHEVFVASSGTEALNILKNQALDLVITDIYMPAPDGLEVMRLVRQLKLNVPFIVISSRAAPLNMFVPARGLGAQLALKKPFTRERLLEAVEAVLDVRMGSQLPPFHRS